ncbi:MAG: HDIG domain-containing protein [Patescibacteria group bacterium]|nr:HDIG domain-containing protein [Patescibacteria group bacterium]
MKLDTRIRKKIDQYQPQGNIDHTSKFFLLMAEVNHLGTKQHCQRVALLAEQVAKKTKKDPKAAFFGGLLHDIGKIILPNTLFDGHDIDKEEYEQIKKHALNGFKILKDVHLFTALGAGLHHNLYKGGYGLSQKDFPSNFSIETIKKLLEISTIISICDFIDAFTHRKTAIKDGSDKVSGKATLKKMLQNKYPNDYILVDIALKCQKAMVA